jgi:hypothetical protein
MQASDFVISLVIHTITNAIAQNNVERLVLINELIIGIQMKNKITIPFIILLFCLQSCKKREATLPEIETIIPVTVTTIDTTIDDYEEVSERFH